MAECGIPSYTRQADGTVIEVCPKEVVSYATNNGVTSYFDAQETKIYEARRDYIRRCRAAGLVPKGDRTNITGYTDLRCEPPPCSGFFCFFDRLVDNILSGDPLRVFSGIFPLLVPGFGIPVIANPIQDSFISAAGQELETVGLPKEGYQAIVQTAEFAFSGGFQNVSSALGEVTHMAWDDIFSSLGDFASDFFSDFNFSDVLNIGAPVAAALVAPQQRPQLSARPVASAASFVPSYNSLQYSVPTYDVSGMQATPAAFPLVGVASAAARMAAPVLAKISATIGRRVGLQKALSLARTLGKQLQSPAAVGAALGITTAELAQLITAGQHRKRRRMNPANSKALRRAAGRIESFHRLCMRVDMLRTRGRRRTSSCGTCRKSPCRCK